MIWLSPLQLPLCNLASIIATRSSAYRLSISISLQRVQNLAARLALNDWTTPPNTLLSKLHWLPVYSRIKFKISIITSKLLIESQPANLRSLIDYYAPTRLLRSSDKFLLRQPRTHTSIGKRAFSVCAPSIWNSIPLPIRLSSSLPSFKRNLKTFHFATSQVSCEASGPQIQL